MSRGGAQGADGAWGLEWGVAAAILLVPLALVALRCSSVEVPLIRQTPGAPWIMAPTQVSAELQQWGDVEPPRVRFVARFAANLPAGGAALEVRALGDARVSLNGEPIAELARAGRRGRAEGRVALGDGLRAAGNELSVEVANTTGPALLSVRSRGLDPPLVTGTDWTVETAERRTSAAALADDTRINPLSLAVETPAEALVAKRDPLIALFLAGVLVFLAGERWLRERGPRVFAWGAPLAASAGWLWLYAAKAARIPPAIGFDARHHVLYAENLAATWRLPLATDGWSTYHPPLFHALTAVLMDLGAGPAAWKALPMLAGLGVVWLAWLLARRLRPDAPEIHGLAALFAATLPVNLYSAAYFSNEALHACLASAGLVAACDLLLRERTGGVRAAAVGALFGLAALSKFTVLVAVPVVGFFLAWKLLFVERSGVARALLPLAAFAAAFLLLAGWFYARSQLLYGTPVLGNWDLRGDTQQWWQQPGFHTPAYWLGFGEALVHPYLSGFHSFWDSVYSTVWGDGFIAGRLDPSGRHTFWDYGFMSAGYWVALPAPALLAVGLVRGAAGALGPGVARRRLALGLLLTVVYAVALAFFALTFQLPFFAQAKGPYLLMLATPLALAFAAGFASLEAWLGRRTGRAGRAFACGWLALYAGTLFLSYAA